MTDEYEKKIKLKEILSEIYIDFYKQNYEKRELFHCKWCGEDITDPYHHYIDKHQTNRIQGFLEGS